MREYLLVIVSMVFVQNYVLARFLGLCPFINVSRKTDAALGMGMAVTFVMTLTSAVTWPLYFYVLELSQRNIFVRLGWLEVTGSRQYAAGIQLYGARDVTVRRCIVHHNEHYGISLRDTAGCTVARNVVWHNGYGIAVGTSSPISASISINSIRAPSP